VCENEAYIRVSTANCSDDDLCTEASFDDEDSEAKPFIGAEFAG